MESVLEEKTSQEGLAEPGGGENPTLGFGDLETKSIGSGSIDVSSKSSLNTYQIRPSLGERFRPVVVNELIHEILHEELTGKTYSQQEAEDLSIKIANLIRQRLKGMAVSRYKYSVQVLLSEQRGAGMVMGMRCLWDADTDSYASNQFLNETIFCMAVVFAVYFY